MSSLGTVSLSGSVRKRRMNLPTKFYDLLRIRRKENSWENLIVVELQRNFQ